MVGFRKVIFNQNAYYTFGLSGAFDPDVIPLYHHHDVQAVVTVSSDNSRFLKEALSYPSDRLHTVIKGIDPQLFYPPRIKHRRIAFLPRKNSQDSSVV